MNHLTWDMLVQFTVEKLEKFLSTPVPLDESLASALPAHKSTFASMVERCTYTDCLTWSRVSLPKSSRVVNLSPSRTWYLLSTGDPRPLIAFKHLTRLEMENVRWYDSLFGFLPPTLLFLRVSTDMRFDAFGEVPPPNLEVLIIHCIPNKTFRYMKGAVEVDLSFRMRDLPLSLKHLCISSKVFSLDMGDLMGSEMWQLPNLKSVLLEGILPASALLIALRVHKELVDVEMRLGDHPNYTGHHWLLFKSLDDVMEALNF